MLGHQNVSGLTPAGAPGVLDDPVVLAAGSAITNGENSVVELGAASILEHTRLVELKLGLVSLNGDADGLLGDSGNQLSLVVLGNIGIRGNGHSVVSSLGSLASVGASGGVGVVRLGGESSVGDGVGEGVVHKTTLAAVVALGDRAVNKLLLREGNKVASGNGVGTLDRSSRGERPARTALSLVLDGGDGIVVTPVNSAGIDLGEGDLIARAGGVHGAKVSSSPLLTRHVSELVDAQVIGVDTLGKLGVVLVDELNVLGERGKASSLLRDRVGLAKSLLELGKHGLHLRCWGSSCQRSKCHNGDRNKLHPEEEKANAIP